MSDFPQGNRELYTPGPKPPEYSELVNTTFTLVKNHRALWWAGMLAVILQGGANINVNYSMRQPTPTMRPDGTVDFGQMFAGTIIEDIIANPMPYIVGTLLLVLLGLLIRLIFGTWAEAALILMGHEAAVQGQTALGRGWRQARQRLGPLIGFQFLLALPFLVVGGAFFAILFPFWLSMMKVLTLPPEQIEPAMAAMQPPQFPALFCLIPPLICLMVPLAFVMLIINVYGFRSCLLAETGAVASIGRGWQLFRRALGNTILTGVFAFIANAVVGLLILVPMIPFGLNFANEFFSTGFSAAMFWRLLPLMLYMAIASVALGGIVRAYFATLWTKVYEVAALSR